MELHPADIPVEAQGLDVEDELVGKKVVQDVRDVPGPGLRVFGMGMGMVLHGDTSLYKSRPMQENDGHFFARLQK
jgi:hypothetical protein